MKPYYYVTHPELSIGSKCKTLPEATTEAERLAEKHPGTAFEILQCLGVSSVPKASTFWMDGVHPKSEARIGWLDAEIEKASNKYGEAVAAYHQAEAECRSSYDEDAQANYWKGRRDALTSLKNSLK